MTARRGRTTALAALLLSAPLAASAVQLPAALRQTTTVYPQCSSPEKDAIAGIMGACAGCLSGACPDACCVEKPASNQYVICQVPAEGADPGCCIRVMGGTTVELAASEIVAAVGKNDEGVCLPAPKGTVGSCPKATCAIAGNNQQQTSCPEGVQVPNPNEAYSSPALCADGTPVEVAAAEIAADGADASGGGATGAPDAGEAEETAVTGDPADEAGVTAAAGALAPVNGTVPAGCKKTFPGYRCQGVKGKPDVKYRGGCCVGTCELDPSKGWGHWCPELSGSAAAAGTNVVDDAAEETGELALETDEAAEETVDSGAGAAGAGAAGAGAAGAGAAGAGAAGAGVAGASLAGPATVAPAPTAAVATAAPTVLGAGGNGTVVAAPATTTIIPVVVSTKDTGEVAAEGKNSTAVGTEGEAKCFHPSSVVELASGEEKRIVDVRIGDKVKVGSGEYSEVFMWSHKDASVESVFLNLTMQTGHSIVVTPGHYLFADGGLVDASDVSVGDRLVLGDGSSSAVSTVSLLNGFGLYNPQTLQGDIVVNGIKASTYTRAVKPDLAHTLLSPLRFAFEAFGFSSQFMELGAPSSIVSLLPQGPSYVAH